MGNVPAECQCFELLTRFPMLFDHAINKLIEYDLIKELGRLEAPGHPILFGTTEEFLRAFGVSSIEDLPELNVDKVESFREQAEEEADEKLNEKLDVGV